MVLDVSAKIWTIDTRPLRDNFTPSRSSASLLGWMPMIGDMSARHRSIDAVVSTRTVVGGAMIRLGAK